MVEAGRHPVLHHEIALCAMDIDIARFRTWYSKIKPLSNNLSIMQDYHPNKQSVVESPKEQTVDESQPEQLIGVLQSVARLRNMKNGISD